MLPNFKIFRKVDRHERNYSFAEDGQIFRRICDTTWKKKSALPMQRRRKLISYGLQIEKSENLTRM